MSALTTFSLEYFLSVSAGLLGGYLVYSLNPNTPAIITFFLIPLALAFVMLKVINLTFPQMNELGYRARTYVQSRAGGEINDLGYVEIFPPLFAIFIVFVILLYNGSLTSRAPAA